jgi:hypothetical protein
LYYFDHHKWKRLEAEDSELPDNNRIELVFRDVTLEYIPIFAIRVQNYNMRQPRGLYMGLTTSVLQFVERLSELNCYLLHFREENPKLLDYDEIIGIMSDVKQRLMPTFFSNAL